MESPLRGDALGGFGGRAGETVGRDPGTAPRSDPYTHFPAAGMAVLIVEDLVSRKWLTEVVSVEETSTQVELGFTAALQAEGLLARVEARHDDGRVDLTVDDETRPILLAVSDTARR